MERELFMDLLERLARLPRARCRPAKSTYRHLDVLAVMLWAALHDRPISWATQRRNWPTHDRTRPLPSNATMSRRLRLPIIHDLLEQLTASMAITGEGERTLVIDGRPLTIARHSGDADAAYGRAAGGMGKGYKLHQIVDLQGNPRAWRVTPLNVNEKQPALEMIEQHKPGEADTLLADNNYDANKLYEAAGQRGIQMLAPRRANAKRIIVNRQSVWRLRAIQMLAEDPGLLKPRRFIETCFATQGNTIGGLGPLPNHVRGLTRVTRWVAVKLAIDAAHRQRRAQKRAA